MKTLKVADLFCGAGGASVSFRRACEKLGLDHQLLAVNHWPTAVATHRKNHPDAVHLCEAVDKVDPKTALFTDPVTGSTFKPKGRLNLLMAGPECTHHSTARGGRPINDQSRATAWHILKWAQELYIDHILIENVPEFREWGPLGANGRPLKSKKGQTYRAFLDALRSLGYKVDDRVLNAADYGDPTTRRRLFIIATRGNKAVQWPVPTHSRSGSPDLFGKTKKWRAAREVIDWKIKGQSIFDRKRPLSQKTMARVLAGLEKFGGKDLKPFIVVLRNNMAGRSIDDPLTTISANGQHHALVEPSACIVPTTHGGDHARAYSTDDPLVTVTGAHRGELALAEAFMLVNNENNAPKSVEDPLATVTGGNRHYLTDFTLSQQSGGAPRSTDQPLQTIAADGAIALVEGDLQPFIVPPRGFSQHDKVDSVDAPLRTIVAASGHTFAVVEPFMVSAGGPNVDARPVSRPMNTVLTRDHMAVVEPFLVPHYGGERPGQAPRVHSVDDPVPTIPATGDGKFEVVTAEFLASYYGTQNISSVDDPVPTVTTKDRFALVAPVINGRKLDIRLRMLKPHELARAMSFGDDYAFTGNQGEQVKQIGNAWPCRLGQALIQTILKDYAKSSTVTKMEGVA